MKLELPDVTLLIYNPNKDPNISAHVLRKVCSIINFGAVKHLVSIKPDEEVGETIMVPNNSWVEGQRIQAYRLHEYFDTSHMLHIETDGYPLRPHLWDPKWLEYDYIGAPWGVEGCPTRTLNPLYRVGNGGCSLQSKKFRQLLYKYRGYYRDGVPSDVWFCQDEVLRSSLRNNRIKFAPISEAIKFSYEAPVPEFPNWVCTHSFGFHGFRAAAENFFAQ
jgi:hypothetical protein